MAVIKKARISKESLPPITVPEADAIGIIAVISTYNGTVPVYQYTTDSIHGFNAGDAINISGIDPSIFNAENVVIYSVPTGNTFEILGAYTSTTYVGGGEVYKTTGSYIVRYRIVSEDRNRVSHWSPQYILSPVSAAAVEDSGIFLQTVNGALSVTWDVSANTTLEDYDIYIAWGVGATQPGVNEGVGSYTYQATVSGNFFTMPIPDLGYTRVSVAIQTRTYPRKYWPEVVVAKTSVIEL